MPPVTRNKAPESSSSASGAGQQQQTSTTRATRSSKPSSDTKSRLAATTTSTAPPPKPVGSTMSRSTTNRMSVVLPMSKKSLSTKEKEKEDNDDKDDKEPMRAFLRIRPAPNSANSTPYITTLSQTAVEMSDPSPAAPRFGMRPSLAPAPSTTYTFTRVFPPDTLQPQFFTATTFPLVKDLLSGENGLVFAYGVTNSGKTYTIQGGNGKGEGGLLPRTLDVLFNSIDGLHGENRWRPAKCSSVEKEPNYGSSVKSKNGPAVEPDVESLMGEEAADKDDTTVKVDRNYEYSVFVSYAEIYNEKIFDLLASESLASEAPTMSRSGSAQSLSRSQAKPLPKYLSALLPKSFSSHLGFGSSGSISSMSGSTGPGGEMPGTVTRKALALKSDPTTNGKYVSGLREIRVRSAQEGRAILKLGQINRTVFGTVANERSSRSHAVFTIKVLRIHKGADKEDPEEVQCARLSVVDLAGSERSKNTHTTGERLKEAGNINKSLMVLGQCMEMLRANQRKIAAGGTLKLGVVPFRHSKLTELFMDFFVGEGRAVMIVNVNPYDTGFDENSHVMRFSALARDVATTTQRALPPRPPPAKSSGMATAARGLSTSIGPGTTGLGATSKLSSPAPPVRTARKVRLSEGTPAETVLEIVEEDETHDEDEDDVPRDTLVDELFEEVDYLRERLFEAEMRASTIEAEIREEVMKEMEERMQAMEKMFMRRLASEVEAGEIKTDRKIDMLQRAGLLQPRQDSDSEDEENIEKSLMIEDETETEEEESEEEDEEEEEEEPESPTPRHKQLTGRPLSTLEEGESFEEESGYIDDEVDESGEEPHATLGEASMDIADDEEEIAETPEAEQDEPTPSKPRAHTPRKQRIDSDDDEYEQDDEEEEEEEDYVPTPPAKPKRESTNRTPKGKNSKGKGSGSTPTGKAKRESSSPVATSVPDQDGDESMSTAAVVPNKRARAARLSASGPGSTYIPAPGEPEAVKKKKRQLGKVSAMTEEQIWAAAMKVEHEKGTMGVRRFGRGSR
ncbi:Kinesin-like protein KIF20A [Rhizoctonia solani]|uniref:Kinesin-like protein KIF20A n=1 Tax=Rhizoctonia solani TaxID=456999 RepID=A0A0K6GH14_9AGAM|nr:Kinesin-like protein KIF20A [Rhizoctonia solani]